MNIVISEATIEDAEGILALQKTACQGEAERYNDLNTPFLAQTLSQIKEEFGSLVFLKATHDDNLVGSVHARLENGTCHIGRLIIHPDYEGNGIGTQLMLETETYFSQADRFELFTGNKSKGNIRFYERIGYRSFREENLSPMVRLVYFEK